MSQLEKSAKSVGAIVVFSLVGKVLGFIRESLIAANYGAGGRTDTFFIAISAISLFAVLLTETIHITLIPILSDIEMHDGKKGKFKHLNNFLNTIILAAILMASLAFFLTPYIIKVLGRGFSGEQFEYAVLLTRIGLPTLMISSVVGIFRGSLESEEMFVKSAIAELPTNIVYLFYLFFLAQYFSITALMVIAMFAEASKLLIQIPSMRKVGYRYKLLIDLDDEYMSEIATLIPPRIIRLVLMS